MKSTHHLSFRTHLVPAALAVSLGLAASSQAATTLTVGSSAPTGNIIASNTTGSGGVTANNVTHQNIASDYVAGDNGSGQELHMLGQSFTTETLGSNNVLQTIAVQSTTNGWRNYGGSLTLNLFEVTNYPVSGVGTGTLLESWTASSGLTAGNVSGGGQWITFNMSASNRTLQNNTIYAFTFSGAGTGSDNTKMYFDWNGTNTNAYSGGQAMSQDVADQPNGLWFGTGAASTGDRVFQVTTIPEPSAALLGGLGMLALLRRRR